MATSIRHQAEEMELLCAEYRDHIATLKNQPPQRKPPDEIIALKEIRMRRFTDIAETLRKVEREEIGQ